MNNTKTMKYFDVTGFAKAVKHKRFVELGIEMREAAKQIKTSSATLSRIENEKLPEINTALNVCHWLKIPITNFVKTKKQINSPYVRRKTKTHRTA